MEQTNVGNIAAALSAPFDSCEVRFKPAVVSGNRALALAYIDARAIEDRLDRVLGVAGWQDEYACTEGAVVCRLRLRIGEEWVTKVDVGGPSKQPDSGDRLKAAFSDALKRAAVKFGIGRYLYRLPAQWVDYDPVKKQFLQFPTLPRWASPRPAPAPAPEPAVNGQVKKCQPKDGQELAERLRAHDGKLAGQGLIQAGDLVKQVVQAGVRAGHKPELSLWNAAGIRLAVDVARQFEAQCQQRNGSTHHQQTGLSKVASNKRN